MLQSPIMPTTIDMTELNILKPAPGRRIGHGDVESGLSPKMVQIGQNQRQINVSTIGNQLLLTPNLRNSVRSHKLDTVGVTNSSNNGHNYWIPIIAVILMIMALIVIFVTIYIKSHDEHQPVQTRTRTGSRWSPAKANYKDHGYNYIKPEPEHVEDGLTDIDSEPQRFKVNPIEKHRDWLRMHWNYEKS